MTEPIVLPPDLLPSDGRFGSGPSRTRYEALADFGQVAPNYIGTSHRQDQIRALVRMIRLGLLEFFNAPEGYEVVLGNGGSTAFWDAAAFGLIERRSQHLAFGEFGTKFAKAVAIEPFLEDPNVITAEPGTASTPVAEPGIDVYAWPQNETSTGVCVPVERVVGTDDGALMLIDGTSGAAGPAIDLSQTDGYYFAPQKGFAGEGGLWVAVLSPAAIERIERISASDRAIPPFLDLKLALENSRKDQTYNTPSIYTVFMLAHQVDWLLGEGGMAWADRRTRESAKVLYDWAEASDFATPFVRDPALRSPVVGTIDFRDDVDAAQIAATLRANGILDTEPYRGLARNQMRVGMFVTTPPEDVAALTRSIDYIVERL
ncbi:phosphoserine transaminase [Epidermidibacterium keratini]|uniref:phosphoserine transaminase n=1 Tax=Epidermidibacterium keratini TaxID=1891644 RepID=A0A7L4YQF0_9ACTN|nr:phosphoserine transaminase [Epidermidibacterium keratini]QHC01153.1 phosphoserine transaminase [Epidermidibacterium keratini]